MERYEIKMEQWSMPFEVGLKGYLNLKMNGEATT